MESLRQTWRWWLSEQGQTVDPKYGDRLICVGEFRTPGAPTFSCWQLAFDREPIMIRWIDTKERQRESHNWCSHRSRRHPAANAETDRESGARSIAHRIRKPFRVAEVTATNSDELERALITRQRARRRSVPSMKGLRKWRAYESLVGSNALNYPKHSRLAKN